MTTSAANPMPNREPASAAHTLSVPRAIFYATLAVGLLDATDGVVFRGVQGQNPIQVLQYIASSLLGAGAYSEGLSSAGLGLVLHFAVSAMVATIYILSSRRIEVLRMRWVTLGLLFGIAVWTVMNLVVLPLSAAAHDSITTTALLNGVIGHALFVGLPISYSARKTEAAR